ncbi:MAG: DUF4390 domain-containing protein [Ghiorsea sp.]|nr:DUF4390 domain-containing protein [Ghiorsea sp.]MDQ7057088.1 DUF4390 domain-containing protein [Ghiorsea sp.]
MSEIHTQTKDGVVYCDVQAFQQEAYILKVIGSGSPMTVFWQFDVKQVRDYWLDKQVVSVRLGRQVIPDLVTQRWLMRDLSGGVVRHTTEAQEAMRFLTGLTQVAVLDTSLLDGANTYILKVQLFLYEGEAEEDSWVPLFKNWGIDMGNAPLLLTKEDD